MKRDIGVGDRIKMWRHTLGLTQEEFARRAGIPKRTLVGYENAEREPGSSALAAIARTGVDMRWLLTGEGEMLPKPAPDKDFSNVPYAHRLEKIGLLLAEMTEQETNAFLDEMFARAQDKAETAKLRRALFRNARRARPPQKNHLKVDRKAIFCRMECVHGLAAAVVFTTRRVFLVLSIT